MTREEVQQKTNEEYLAYLQSDEWKEKAKQRLQIDNYRCVGCGTAGNALNRLNVHHLNYRRIFHENPYEDLVVLCESCHCIAHHILYRITDEQGGRYWQLNPNIPNISTYSLDGTETATRKGN